MNFQSKVWVLKIDAARFDSIKAGAHSGFHRGSSEADCMYMHSFVVTCFQGNCSKKVAYNLRLPPVQDLQDIADSSPMKRYV